MNSIFNDASCVKKGAICTVGFPEEVVLSVVSVEKDGIVIIVGVEVVKGILFCQFLCVTLKFRQPSIRLVVSGFVYFPKEDPSKQPVEVLGITWGARN